MPKKILTIETGGTFATASVGSVRTLANTTNEKLIYDYDEVVERVQRYYFEIEKARPIYTLSENMTFEKLNKLISFMYDVDYSKYDGIIITHGTDTMAYTANILSMLFSHMGVPIVMVSANHPISMDKSNGRANFLGALDFINCFDAQGVYVVYKNYRDEVEVHLGSRIKQMNQVIDSYESFKNLRLGIIENGIFVQNSDPNVPTIDRIKRDTTMCFDKHVDLVRRILLIYPYVGMRYDYFNIDESIDAVVCGVYHSGTVCAENAYIDQSINSLIARTDKYDIPVYIGELSSKSDYYESFSAIESSKNLYPIYDISLENLYAKANIAHGLFDTAGERASFINDVNVFFEKVVD